MVGGRYTRGVFGFSTGKVVVLDITKGEVGSKYSNAQGSRKNAQS